MSDPTLVLRDIHQPPSPPWWPPAPGWWLLVAVLLLACAGWAWWHRRRNLRHAAIARLFDDAVAAAASPAAKIAAMSEHLRRAARRIDPSADRLEGEAWLQFLDGGLATPRFATGAGRVLLDGGFRREVGSAEVEALRTIARERFSSWMGIRR